MHSTMDIPLTAIAEAAPDLARRTLNFMYGDMWQHPDLSSRDRSLATIAALAAGYRVEQLEFHIGLALDNDLTATEIAELINHVTKFASPPTGVSVISIAQKMFNQRGLRIKPRVAP